MWKHGLVVGLFPFRTLLSHFPIVPPSVRGDFKNSLNLNITKITLLSPQDDLKMSVKKGKKPLVLLNFLLDIFNLVKAIFFTLEAIMVPLT